MGEKQQQQQKNKNQKNCPEAGTQTKQNRNFIYK